MMLGPKVFLVLILLEIYVVQAVAKLSSPLPRQIPQQCSGLFDFALSNIDVIEQRSADKDTIYIGATIAVGNDTYGNITNYYGNHGKGNFNADILFQNVPVASSDVAVFAYLIVNSSGSNKTTIEKALTDAVVKLAVKGVAIAAGATESESLTALIDSTIVDIAEDVTEDILIGISLTDFASFLGIIGVTIAELITSNCDGFIGAAIHAYRGQDICSDGGLIVRVDINVGTTQSDQELLIWFYPWYSLQHSGVTV